MFPTTISALTAGGVPSGWRASALDATTGRWRWVSGTGGWGWLKSPPWEKASSRWTPTRATWAWGWSGAASWRRWPCPSLPCRRASSLARWASTSTMTTGSCLFMTWTNTSTFTRTTRPSLRSCSPCLVQLRSSRIWWSGPQQPKPSVCVQHPAYGDEFPSPFTTSSFEIQ